MGGSDALTVLGPPFAVAYLGLAPQEPSGPPKFLTLLSTPTTRLVDPDRPSGRPPTRFRCVGFWRVQPIAVCISRETGAVSRVGACGLSCGRRGTLCTLHLVRSVFTSSTGATLGRSGWLDLAPQGLPPCKKRQAPLGARTLALTCCRKRERRRSGRCRQSGAVPGSAGYSLPSDDGDSSSNQRGVLRCARFRLLLCCKRLVV
jgi:hypothetical protein